MCAWRVCDASIMRVCVMCMILWHIWVRALWFAFIDGWIRGGMCCRLCPVLISFISKIVMALLYSSGDALDLF